MWKRALAGLLALLAGFAAVYFCFMGLGFLSGPDWFVGLILVVLAALAGVVTFRLGRFAWRGAGALAPGWVTWTGASVLVALPIYFVIAFTSFYGTRLPMRLATGEMKGALLDVVSAQEEHFKTRGTFAHNLAAFDTVQWIKRWHDTTKSGVSLRITRGDRAGWAARAEHRRVTTVCTIAMRAGVIDSTPAANKLVCSDGKMK